MGDTRILEIRREEMRQLGQSVVVVMRQEAPKDIRRMERSIAFRTDISRGGRGEIRLTVYVGAPYAKYVMSGTRPHWAPARALQGWASRHGINVYALQQSIAKRGTSVRALDRYGTYANQFHVRAFAKSQPEIDETARRIARRVVNELNAFVPGRPA